MNIFMFQKVRGFRAKNPASWVNGQILKVKKIPISSEDSRDI